MKTIVKKYNKACRELSSLIQAQRTWMGRCPIRPLKELPTTGLWDLGIDNPCWDDLRYDADDEDAAPPGWQTKTSAKPFVAGYFSIDARRRRGACSTSGRMSWSGSRWSGSLSYAP